MESEVTNTLPPQEPQNPEHHPPGINESFRLNARLDEIERHQREEQKEEREYKRRQLRFDGLMVLFTCLLFLTSAVSNLIMLSQTRAAIRSADAAAVAAKTAQDSIIESQKNRAASEVQSREALDASITIAHNEQRAWIVARTPTTPVRFGAKEPITFPVNFVNIGKTPAANVEAYVRVELVQSGREPSFSYEPGTSMIFRNGELVPNDEVSHEIPARARHDPIILTLDRVSRLLDGSEYAAFYGDVTYQDISGRHWTRFCREFYRGPTDMWYPKKCYAYNSSGDGKLPPNNPAK